MGILGGMEERGEWRRFTFLMDEDMYVALRALAGACDGSVSGLVRETLQRMLGQYYAFGGTVGRPSWYDEELGGGGSSDVPV